MKFAGFTYVEILVAVMLMALVLVPSIEAFNTSINANKVYGEKVVDHYRLVDLLEQTLAEPFADLNAEADLAGGATIATNYSDPPGTIRRRVVFIAAYDGDNADADNDPFTGTDADLLWLSVAIENRDDQLVALVTP